jgi:nitronate monooxygenase
VNTPWLANYRAREAKLQACAKADPARCAIGLHCLSQCGLRDGLEKAGQFCIDAQLVAALKGDVRKGLFFRGSESLPFGRAIRPVRELIDYYLSGVKPDAGAADASSRASSASADTSSSRRVCSSASIPSTPRQDLAS